VEVFSHYSTLSTTAFHTNLPALDHFPHSMWARVMSRGLRRMTSAQLFPSGPGGYKDLRRSLAEYLVASRGANCNPDQVMIVSGVREAIDLTARLLLNPGDRVMVEDPGYQVSFASFRAAGAELLSVPVDADGAAPRAAQFEGARLVYLTPGHQFPTGVTMSASRRMEILHLAAKSGTYIFEDDYDSEFRYTSRTLGALQGMDTNDRVIYLGTFSKVLFPALRLGYMVVPHELITRFVRARETLDLCSPLLYQLVLTDFLNEGHFARHLRRMRAVYLRRRDAVIAAVREHAADVMTIENTDAGLHLLAFLDDNVDDRALARRAAQQDLFPASLSALYASTPSRCGLILGFGGSDESVLAEGVRTLAGLIRASA
jgi:GntR family transcriptional regulator/MocR family aminotransferase